MDCLFCKIIQGTIPAHRVYEDDAVIAILDVHPQAEGHTMVLPKKHTETILELKNEDVASVFVGVGAVTALLKAALSPDGFTIGINHGKASGQEVEHLHIHIIPRFSGDGGGSLHSVLPTKEQELSVEEVYKKIVAKE